MTFNHDFVVAPELISHTDSKTGHRYYTTPEGNWYESVTTFLDRLWGKQALQEWRLRVGNTKADAVGRAARKHGKAVHGLLEQYLRNEVLVRDNNDILANSAFTKMIPILNRMNNIRLIEQSLYSNRLKLAGTPDCISDYEAELAVVDFKTSTKVKKKKYIVNYFLQAACYGVMFEERYGEMPKKAVIIMGTGDHPLAQVFVEPMDLCIKMLDKFIADPVKFQGKMK